MNIRKNKTEGQLQNHLNSYGITFKEFFKELILNIDVAYENYHQEQISVVHISCILSSHYNICIKDVEYAREIINEYYEESYYIK